MRRPATDLKHVPSGLFCSGKQSFVCCTIVIIVLILCGCSSDEPVPLPECHVSTDEQAIPTCIEVTASVETIKTVCELSAEITNNCDDEVTLNFYCDPEAPAEGSWSCPDERVVAAHRQEFIDLRRIESEDTTLFDIAIAITTAGSANFGDDEQGALQPSVSIRLLYSRPRGFE